MTSQRDTPSALPLPRLASAPAWLGQASLALCGGLLAAGGWMAFARVPEYVGGPAVARPLGRGEGALVEIAVPATAAEAIRPGSVAEFESAAGGYRARGAVAGVAARPQDGGRSLVVTARVAAGEPTPAPDAAGPIRGRGRILLGERSVLGALGPRRR